MLPCTQEKFIIQSSDSNVHVNLTVNLLNSVCLCFMLECKEDGPLLMSDNYKCYTEFVIPIKLLTNSFIMS